MKYTNSYLPKGNSICLTQLALDLGESSLTERGEQNFCYACCLGRVSDPGVPLYNTDLQKIKSAVDLAKIVREPTDNPLKTGVHARYQLRMLTRDVPNSIAEMFPAGKPEAECPSLMADGLCEIPDSKPTYCKLGGCLYARALYSLINDKGVSADEFSGLSLAEKVEKIEDLCVEHKVRIKIR